jgi:hypothetical protein
MTSPLDALKVPVTIGARRRTLFYPIGAFQFMRRNLSAESFAKLSDGKILDRALEDTALADRLNDALWVLLCAGLLHEDESLTPKQVSFQLLPAEAEAACKAMLQALNLAAQVNGAGEGEAAAGRPLAPKLREKKRRARSGRNGPSPASTSDSATPPTSGS